MPKQQRFVFPATDDDAICAAQQISAAGYLLINGAARSTALATLGFAVGGSFNIPVTLTSTGNLSGVSFIITGRTRAGITTTETIAGPNNNTVTTTAKFNIVESVYASGAVATGVKIGFSSTGTTSWIPADFEVGRFNAGLGFNVTGTINYTLQHTFDNVYNTAITPFAFDCADTNVVNATADANTNYDKPVGAWQININSSSAEGSLVAWIIENGINA